MERYSTHHKNKKHELLRHFLFKKRKSLIISLLLGIVAFSMYQYWANHQKSVMKSTSMSWESLQTAMEEEPSSTKQLDAAKKFAHINHNNYGAMISLWLARRYVKQNDFDNAKIYLNQTLTQTNESNLKSIINLRLARIQLQQNNVDEALTILKRVHGKGWIGLAENIRGDAQYLKGDYQASRDAYDKSLSYGTAPALIRMKINHLAH